MNINHKLYAAFAAALVFGTAANAQNVQSIDFASSEQSSRPLQFDLTNQIAVNEFYRKNEVAAHIVLRTGAKLRALVAFPAGNSGVSMWFAPQKSNPQWKIVQPASAIIEKDEFNRSLYGVEFIAEIATNRLEIEKTILGSIRTIRDYEYKNPIPAQIFVNPKIENNKLIYSRPRLDGECNYYLSVEVLNGSATEKGFVSSGDNLRLKFRALSGEKPLQPLNASQLLNANANNDVKSRNSLEFLSYRDKFLAGSWRFNTYFGRDTLLSARLLQNAITPTASQSALQSVLSRLNDGGEVAHEEAIGEYAIIENQRHNLGNSAKPFFDYSMIDGNYILPIVARDLLGNPKAVDEFLRKKNDRGETNGKSLIRNFRLVIAKSEAFANGPKYQNLIALKSGKKAGQWRDSDFGIGGGIYPYDVNAVFVPYALAAIAELNRMAVLNDYTTQEDRVEFSKAGKYSRIWRDKAPKMFEIVQNEKAAKSALNAYSKNLGLDTPKFEAPKFHAIALKENGEKIAVEHSDEGFLLLFGNPSERDLDIALYPLLHQYPLGLISDAGMMVANPVFANANIQNGFGKNEYHGAVIWSWQQALMAEGLARQIRRTDLSPKMRAKLQTAQNSLWRVINLTNKSKNAELWTWQIKNGKIGMAEFGSSGLDADESNAAQLWSNVYLAIKAPN